MFPGASGPNGQIKPTHKLLVQVAPRLSPKVLTTREVTPGDVLGTYETEALTRVEPIALWTEIPIMSWVMQKAPCKTGSSTEASLLKWTLYLHD